MQKEFFLNCTGSSKDLGAQTNKLSSYERKRVGVISSGYLVFTLPEPDLDCKRWLDCANSNFLWSVTLLSTGIHFPFRIPVYVIRLPENELSLFKYHWSHYSKRYKIGSFS